MTQLEKFWVAKAIERNKESGYNGFKKWLTEQDKDFLNKGSIVVIDEFINEFNIMPTEGIRGRLREVFFSFHVPTININ